MALAKVNVYSKGKAGGGDQMTVDQLPVDHILNNNSWQVIAAISTLGIGDVFWDVGDCKEITLNGKIGSYLTLTNKTLCVFILHFNYEMNGTADNNIVWGGFKTALTNGVDVALCESGNGSAYFDGKLYFNLNHKTTATSGDGQFGHNHGGWKGTDFRYDILGATSNKPSKYNTNKTTTNVGYDATTVTLASPPANTLLAALPSDFRNALRLWTRWIDAVGNSSNVDENIRETVDAVTLLAEFEVVGTNTFYANQYEKNHQTQMDYYKQGNSTIKYDHSNTGKAVSWWLASPYRSSTYRFCQISSDGTRDTGTSPQSKGLAPAFLT